MWLCPVGLCPYHIPSWGSISHLWGVQEGILDHFSQRRDRKSSCATQYHVILCRWRSLALDDVPSAGTLVATVHSRENPRIPHDERLVPIFLWRRGFEWFMGAQKAPWARHTGHRAAAQHSC